MPYEDTYISYTDVNNTSSLCVKSYDKIDYIYNTTTKTVFGRMRYNCIGDNKTSTVLIQCKEYIVQLDIRIAGPPRQHCD